MIRQRSVCFRPFPSRTRRVWLAMLLFFMAAATCVRADSSMPDCANDEACVALVNRAQEASTAGNLDEALRQYKLAYAVRADPRILFSIGRILHKQGMRDEALDYYQRFLAAPVTEAEPRQRAQTYIAELSALPSGAVHVSPGKESAAAEKSIPLYRKWWLWTIIGGVVVAGVVTGVAVGVAVNNSNRIPEGVPVFRFSF